MREFKFRYRLELITSEWGDYKVGDIDTFYFNLNNPNNGLSRFSIDKRWGIVSCDEFTGLKDKNGTDIYENDKVRTRTLSNELNDNDFSIYEVGFFNGSFCLRLGEQFVRQWKDGTHDWYSLENTESFDIEVI
tara:strand:- start:5800 stop:6198 length:399 start_codon:yes stop_codon:yes gene_type:complete